MRVLACLTHAKLKMWHVHTFLCGILACACEPVNVRNKLALGFPHYTCDVATGTVAVAVKYNPLQMIGFVI